MTSNYLTHTQGLPSLLDEGSANMVHEFLSNLTWNTNLETYFMRATWLEKWSATGKTLLQLPTQDQDGSLAKPFFEACHIIEIGSLVSRKLCCAIDYVT